MYWITHTYQNFIHCRNSFCELIESLYHWVIQIGREPQGSLDQPDGPRKHNCESTLCCSRLLSIWIFKTSEDGECMTYFGKCFYCFLLWNRFSLPTDWISLGLILANFSYPSVMHHWGACSISPVTLLAGTARLVSCPLQSHPFFRLNKPSSLSFSSLAKCSSLHLGSPLLNLVLFIQCLSCSEGPKAPQVGAVFNVV